jgi:hypothetical protein
VPASATATGFITQEVMLVEQKNINVDLGLQAEKSGQLPDLRTLVMMLALKSASMLIYERCPSTNGLI